MYEYDIVEEALSSRLLDVLEPMLEHQMVAVAG